MKCISIVTACYNEEQTIREIYHCIKCVMMQFVNYAYEHIFIDNASIDQTVSILREIATHDKQVKVIINNRNFGHVRSPFHGLLQAKGDAVVLIAADLQDPPELIVDFIRAWEAGSQVVLAIKSEADESWPVFLLRSCYYRVIKKISEVPLYHGFHGFGLYDCSVIVALRGIEDPYPYFRGLIAELGFSATLISYRQPRRLAGVTKNNFYSLYDMAMLGVTTHSKVPLRFATIGGFVLALLSLCGAMILFILKLSFWAHFPMGIAPILIAIFFFSAMQLFFIGLLGEYILAIQTQVLKRPRVMEREKINFTDA